MCDQRAYLGVILCYDPTPKRGGLVMSMAALWPVIIGCSSRGGTVIGDQPPGPGAETVETAETDSPDDTADTADTAEPDDTAAPESDLEPAGDYTAAGPFIAGQRWGTTTGTNGNTLYVATWYPSTDPSGESTWYGWEGWWNPGESLYEVTPACDEPRPVMVHSHGNTSLSWEMFWLPEFLSTHGWIVVAPDHEGNTAYDYSLQFGDIYLRRPIDIRDTYDWLLAESAAPDSPLYGCVDEAAGYVVSGYSFGGYTAYATGGGLINLPGAPESINLSDERVTGVIAMAPWNAYEALTTGTSNIDVPVLTIGGRDDATVGIQYLAMHGEVQSTPRLLADFTGVGHYSFTPIYCWSSGDGCGEGYYDQDDFIAVIKTTVIAWLEHIRDRPGAIDQLPESSDALTWTLVQ